jgi:hypothetical protein
MFEKLKTMVSKSVVAKYVWYVFKRFGFDITIVVISVWVLWKVYAGVLRPSQEAIVKTVLLYSLANLVWYGSRRLFVGKIDWSSDGDKWRKILAIVMLAGAYLIFSRA